MNVCIIKVLTKVHIIYDLNVNAILNLYYIFRKNFLKFSEKKFCFYLASATPVSFVPPSLKGREKQFKIAKLITKITIKTQKNG